MRSILALQKEQVLLLQVVSTMGGSSAPMDPATSSGVMGLAPAPMDPAFATEGENASPPPPLEQGNTTSSLSLNSVGSLSQGVRDSKQRHH
jgi:hypothetical protein